MTGPAEVHVTDFNTFLRCRRLWNWQSTMREGLQPAGMPAPLLLGQGVHSALDKYYSADEEDRTARLLLLAFHNWMDKRAERMKRRTGPLWKDEKEMIEEMRELGSGMLLHYHLWAPGVDQRFEFLSTEQFFKVPMPLPEFINVDADPFQRSRPFPVEVPPSRPSRRVLRGCSDMLDYAGRFDAVVRDRESGELFVLDFKTTRSLSNMQWTYRSVQGAAYVWAARQYFEEPIEGIIYRVLLKKVPQNPKTLVRGGYSRAKSQKTSFHWLKYFFEMVAEEREVDVNVVFRENEELLRYFHGQGNDYFDQTLLRKTPQQLESTMRALYYIGQDMANPETPVFPQPGFHCNWCQFENVCTLKEYGGDWQGLLEAEFAPRTYWEKFDDE